MNSSRKRRKIEELVSKGRGYFQSGDIGNAEKNLQAALKLGPQDPEALYALGVLYNAKGQSKNAARFLSRCLKINSNSAAAHNEYGVAELSSGSLEAGFGHIKMATQLDPTNTAFKIDLATALIQLNRYDEAIKFLSELNKRVRDNFTVKVNFAEALRKTGDYQRSKSILLEADKEFPNNPVVANNLGLVLEECGDFLTAVDLFRNAIDLNPNVADYHCNLGHALRFLGQYSEAIQASKRACQLAPSDPDYAMKLAVLLLMTGDFEEGWPLYKKRWFSREQKKLPRPGPNQWQGEPLAGKTLLIKGEQGPGDEILFATCLPDVIDKSHSEQIFLTCDKRLAPCFARTFPEIAVVPSKNDNNNSDLNYDLEVAIGDLPSMFRSNINDIRKAGSRRLISDPILKQKWRQRFSELGNGLKIGIAWRGGVINVAKKQRSFSLEEFLPILKTPGCHFINLQYGDTEKDLALIRQNHNVRIHDWAEVDPLHELENQIAQIDCLDLVIQCSNTSAHIAAALGKPTWIAQAFSPYWTWFVDTEDSPWYDDVTQFRPKSPGAWNTVVDDIATKLGRHLKMEYGK